VGSAALVNAGGASVLVAHTAADTFAAFNATCTHQACTITAWAAPNFECPCHGSLFNTNGDVMRGPASRALQKYTASLSGNTLTVTG
jgi:Rieske Fe-S protein